MLFSVLQGTQVCHHTHFSKTLTGLAWTAYKLLPSHEAVMLCYTPEGVIVMASCISVSVCPCMCLALLAKQTDIRILAGW